MCAYFAVIGQWCILSILFRSFFPLPTAEWEISVLSWRARIRLFFICLSPLSVVYSENLPGDQTRPTVIHGAKELGSYFLLYSLLSIFCGAKRTGFFFWSSARCCPSFDGARRTGFQFFLSCPLYRKSPLL